MPGTMSRRKRERQRHRREILVAARELFSSQGFDRTSMSQIATQAQFAVGTLYKFFKDKQDLYRALILDTVQEVVPKLSAALKSPGSELEKLERYIETKAHMFVQHLPTARLYFGQTAGSKFLPTLGLDLESRALYQRLREALEKVFRGGIRKGLFLKIEPRLLVFGLEGISNAFLDLLTERPDDFSAESLADITKTIFFERILLKAKSS